MGLLSRRLLIPGVASAGLAATRSQASRAAAGGTAAAALSSGDRPSGTGRGTSTPRPISRTLAVRPEPAAPRGYTLPLGCLSVRPARRGRRSPTAALGWYALSPHLRPAHPPPHEYIPLHATAAASQPYRSRTCAHAANVGIAKPSAACAPCGRCQAAASCRPAHRPAPFAGSGCLPTRSPPLSVSRCGSPAAARLGLAAPPASLARGSASRGPAGRGNRALPGKV